MFGLFSHISLLLQGLQLLLLNVGNTTTCAQGKSYSLYISYSEYLFCFCLFDLQVYYQDRGHQSIVLGYRLKALETFFEWKHFCSQLYFLNKICWEPQEKCIRVEL